MDGEITQECLIVVDYVVGCGKCFIVESVTASDGVLRSKCKPDAYERRIKKKKSQDKVTKNTLRICAGCHSSRTHHSLHH